MAQEAMAPLFLKKHLVDLLGLDSKKREYLKRLNLYQKPIQRYLTKLLTILMMQKTRAS